jgi:hypothetical protein
MSISLFIYLFVSNIVLYCLLAIKAIMRLSMGYNGAVMPSLGWKKSTKRVAKPSDVYR